MESSTFLLLGAGLIAGILSGLLGIGGGIVLVPALLFILAGYVPPELLMKVALATSLATIPFTSAFATLQQHKAGNSNFGKVKQLVGGVAVGGVLGGITASMMPGTVLKAVFCLFALYVGTQMFLNKQPKFKLSFNPRSAAGAGVVTGAMSSWVGIGGGNILVPFLNSTGEDMKKAAGITSPVAVVVAIFASAGYAIAASQMSMHVAGVYGFVHFAAFALIVATSLIGVFFGVRLAGKVSALTLKRVFAVLLLATGTKILFGLLV